VADVVMPRLSDTMQEGTVARWLKRPGERVQRGDVLAEIETDKATMDLEAFEDGVVERLLVEEGATVPIGQPIASIGTPGVASATPEAPRAPAPAPPPAPPPAPVPAGDAAPGHAPVPGGGAPPAAPEEAASVRSSPLARTLARRHGVDLASLSGSGPGGRVVRADVERAIAGTARAPETPPAGPGVADVEEVALSRVRRRTAERLSESALVPTFSLTSTVDAGRLVDLRAELNEHLAPDGERVTVTDLLVKACATVLTQHPAVNASFANDRILRFRRVHIGVAVAVPDGLIVPVVHDADAKTLRQVAAEARALAERARAGTLTLDDVSGGTFTISNLGMYGIDDFTAVINPPQAAILSVGAVAPTPVVRDGALAIGTTMKVTLTVDHRALDGAGAAAFLADLRRVLEHPLGLVL